MKRTENMYKSELRVHVIARFNVSQPLYFLLRMCAWQLISLLVFFHTATKSTPFENNKCFWRISDSFDPRVCNITGTSSTLMYQHIPWMLFVAPLQLGPDYINKGPHLIETMTCLYQSLLFLKQHTRTTARMCPPTVVYCCNHGGKSMTQLGSCRVHKLTLINSICPDPVRIHVVWKGTVL